MGAAIVVRLLVIAESEQVENRNLRSCWTPVKRCHRAEATDNPVLSVTPATPSPAVDCLCRINPTGKLSQSFEIV